MRRHAARSAHPSFRFLPNLELLEDRNAPDNLAPIAFNDLFEFDEDELFELFAPGVLFNDIDSDSDPMSAVLVTGPSVGQLTFNSDGSFTYEPEGNYHGTVTFTYKVFDGTDWSNLATVTLVVNPVSDAPTAVDDEASTDEDTPVTFGVLGNDFDVDGDSFSIASWTNPSHGAVTLNGDQSFTYTPAAGWSGQDSFTYTIIDQLGTTDTATVSVTVAQIGPAFDDDAFTPEDESVDIDVLANDDWEDPGSLAITSVGSPENGIAVVNPDATITYTPNENWHGLDHFSYAIHDSVSLEDDVAEVWVFVESVNDQPVAEDDGFDIGEDESITFDPLANDYDVDTDDELSIIDATDPAHGRLAFNDDGTITYWPDGDYNGPDSFVYTLWDGHEDGEAAGTVSIDVIAIDDVPIAYHDAYSFEAQIPNTPLRTWHVNAPGLLSNDIDYDYRDPGYDFHDLVVNAATIDDSELEGVVVVYADGSFDYTPPPGFYDDWTYFTYTIGDEVSDSPPATAWLYVEPLEIGAPPDPVDATDDDYYFAGNDVEANVSSNDHEGIARLILNAPPKYGRLMPLTADGFGIDGSFTYTPDFNYAGTVPGVVRTVEGFEETTTLAYMGYADDFRQAEAVLRLNAVKAHLNIHGMNEVEENVVGGLVVLPNYDSVYGWNNVTDPVDPTQPPNDPEVKRTPRKKILIMPTTSWPWNVVLTRDLVETPNGSYSRLDVYDAEFGGSKLQFNGADNVFSALTIPIAGKVLWVEGYSYSDAMRDTGLKLEAEGLPGSADTVRFTVLHIDQPTVKFSKNETVSEDNDKRENYIRKHVGGRPGTIYLGLRHTHPLFASGLPDTSQKAWGWNFEVRAEVHPHDFTYLRSGVYLDRDVSTRLWKRTTASPPAYEDITQDANKRTYTARHRVPPGNDPSPNIWRDDTPSAGGAIYDLDAPGFYYNTADAQPFNRLLRFRMNSRSLPAVIITSYGDFYRVRGGFSREYFVAFSMLQASAIPGHAGYAAIDSAAWGDLSAR